MNADVVMRTQAKKKTSGKWKVESGKWKVESGKWEVESGKWKVELWECGIA